MFGRVMLVLPPPLATVGADYLAAPIGHQREDMRLTTN